jgi:hypothetical protein
LPNLLTMADNSPHYEELPVFWPRLKAFIEIGSFIFFYVNENNEKTRRQLGQIVCSTSGTQVKVLLFNKPNNGTHLRHITSEIGRSLTEVVQTSETKVIFTKDIHDIAWVFDEGTLSAMSAYLQGISNVFIVRFDSNNQQIKNFVSFPCNHPGCIIPKSLAKKLYDDLERVRDLLTQVLCRRSELQGEKARVLKHSFACHEFWSWLKLVLVQDHSMIIHDELTCKKPRIRLIHQMKRIKVSTETLYEIFRFETKNDLERLRGLFGETILYGVREKFPKLGLGAMALVGNEALNIIRASKDDDDNVAFPLVPSKHSGGVDLVYKADGTLSIRVRYEKLFYQAGDETIDIPEHLNKVLTEYKWGPYYYEQNQAQQPPPDDGDDDDSIAIDDMFDWTDKVTYEVTEVLANQVVARRLSDGAEVNFEDVDAVREAIKEKNEF